MSLPISRAEAQRISSVADLRSAIANARAGATVSIPSGTYDIGSVPLRIQDKRNVHIVGAGAGRTIIRVSASAPFIFELAGSNDDLEVAGMTLEGASRLRKNTHALASGSDRMNLTRAWFHDLEIRNVAVGSHREQRDHRSRKNFFAPQCVAGCSCGCALIQRARLGKRNHQPLPRCNEHRGCAGRRSQADRSEREPHRQHRSRCSRSRCIHYGFRDIHKQRQSILPRQRSIDACYPARWKRCVGTALIGDVERPPSSPLRYHGQL